MTTLTSMKQEVNICKSNATIGNYHPYFFYLQKFEISEVNYESLYFNEFDIETQLLEGDFSFAYLREDKLRAINIHSLNSSKVSFDQFLDQFSIKIMSSNLFKTGKYLSRVFRPVRYGGFYKGLDIHINSNPKYNGVVTDGISLISLDLAKSLGWKNARPEMSAQFTLFNSLGLVKGHCVISDKINSDVVIYGEGNIKKEISLNNCFDYVALEPVKLGTSLRLDIQSMLNLWGIFGAEQYLNWAYSGIEEFKKALYSGELKVLSDNLFNVSEEEYNSETFTLRKAIWHKIDIRKFPGLVRMAWNIFRSSMLKYADDKEGNAIFRIPVPSGKRGYLRIDLRNHDCKGNFNPTVRDNEVELDEYGNLWMSVEQIDEKLEILGGADFDDGVGVIPVEDNKAVIYRNPNQFGEFIISKLISQNSDIEHSNIITGSIPQKNITLTKKDVSSKEYQGNNELLKQFLGNLSEEGIRFIKYNKANLLKAYNFISQNNASIGFAANAEMFRSALRIEKPELFNYIVDKYNWNLERIIDSSVKEGNSAEEDMKSVYEMYKYFVAENIQVPKSLMYRLPDSVRNVICMAENHQVDQLLEAIKYFIDKADLEILGKGSASRGNRVEGWIDHLETPIIALGKATMNNCFYDLARKFLSKYNKEIASIIEKYNADDNFDESKKIEGIKNVQAELLEALSKYSDNERKEIVKALAYFIYSSPRAIHDSILWISDIENLQGTARDMIKVLSDLGEGFQIDFSTNIKRFKRASNTKVKTNMIRVWQKVPHLLEQIVVGQKINITSAGAKINGLVFNLGDEYEIEEGVFSIREISPAYSKKNKNKVLSNSLTLYLS